MENQPDWVAFCITYAIALGVPLVTLMVHLMLTKSK